MKQHQELSPKTMADVYREAASGRLDAQALIEQAETRKEGAALKTEYEKQSRKVWQNSEQTQTLISEIVALWATEDETPGTLTTKKALRRILNRINA